MSDMIDISDIRHNHNKLQPAKHSLEHKHKWINLDILEKFHVYKATNSNPY
jgi:hypothetical protein